MYGFFLIGVGAVLVADPVLAYGPDGILNQVAAVFGLGRSPSPTGEFVPVLGMTIVVLGFYYMQAGFDNNIDLMYSSIFGRLFFSVLAFVLVYYKRVGSWILLFAIEHIITSLITGAALATTASKKLL